MIESFKAFCRPLAEKPVMDTDQYVCETTGTQLMLEVNLEES